MRHFDSWKNPPSSGILFTEYGKDVPHGAFDKPLECGRRGGKKWRSRLCVYSLCMFVEAFIVVRKEKKGEHRPSSVELAELDAPL